MFKRLVNSPGARVALICAYLIASGLLVTLGRLDHDPVGSANFYGLAAFIAVFAFGIIQQVIWLARRAGGRHE